MVHALKEILEDWQPISSQISRMLARQADLPLHLSEDLVVVIQGVRRCGKSTLLTQFPERYCLDPTLCYYCNFEDPRLLDVLNHHLLSDIVTLARKEVPPEIPCYFFFDEIQNVEGWEKWLHSQLERHRNNYFTITGSNSCLLSGEFATALTGRHISCELFPFSFNEFQSLFPGKGIEDYLQRGGFPRVLTYERPYQLLQEYFNDIILRDVLKRVKARTPDAIKQVVKMAFDSCGAQLSYRKIAASIELSVDTVKGYLEACEQAYLLFSCPFFSFSEKKRHLKQKKYYPIDTGLRSSITHTQNRDLGKALEIVTFLHLKKSFEEVYYWCEPYQGEVDFVVKHGNEIIPYQVTWNQPERRHQKSLDAFYTAFPKAHSAEIITKENVGAFLSATLKKEAL